MTGGLEGYKPGVKYWYSSNKDCRRSDSEMADGLEE